MSNVLVPLPEAAVPDRPTPEGKRALRQALGYIARADAPGTRRVYAADWRHFSAWRLQNSLVPLPAMPATLAAYLAMQAEGYTDLSRRARPCG